MRTAAQASPGRSDAQTAVLGAAVGYTAEQISPFLTSLRRSGYHGEVVLVVEPAMARSLARLPLFEGVTFIAAPQWLPARYRLWGLRRSRAGVLLTYPVQALLWAVMNAVGWLPLVPRRRLALQMALAACIYPPHTSRYIHYFRFLQRQPRARVLLTDVRDVLFQADPFALLPERGLAVSMEAGATTISGDALNAHWVRLIYGAGALEKIGGCPIACSGVTYGDGEAIRGYLELMVRGVLALNLRATWHSVLDQGIHNMLLWTGQCGAFSRLEAFASPVATLHGVTDAEVKVSADGKLLNLDGSVVAVIHQYDRLPALCSTLLARLGQPAALAA